jgi:hypothetical protein
LGSVFKVGAWTAIHDSAGGPATLLDNTHRRSKIYRRDDRIACAKIENTFSSPTASENDHQQTVLQRLPRGLQSATTRPTESRFLSSSICSLILPKHHTESKHRYNHHNADHHHKDTVTIAWCDDSIRTSRPLPADTTTRRPLQPLDNTQSQSLPDTRRVTTEPERVR